MSSRTKTPRYAMMVGAVISALACSPEPQPDPAPAPAAAKSSEPPAKPETPPASDPVRAEPVPAIPSVVDSDPVVAERKLALANVGRSAFEALQAGDFAALAELTPIDAGPLRDACPSMRLSTRKELEARFDHCHETIAWDAVREAQVFAGKPTGDPAAGCEAGIEDYGRIQLFVHLNDERIWRVDLFGAVGQDGNAIGINGEVACTAVDEAPPL